MKLSADQKMMPFEYLIRSTDKPNLITLQIDLTDFCVCKCKGCEHWRWPIKIKMETSVLENNVFPYLRQFPTLQTIVFSGGEALLHPDVEPIIRRLKQEGYYVGIITSGLGKANIDWKSLSEDCSWIRFSSDGFTREKYADTRGVDLYDLWLDNLKTLLEYNKETHCETRINVTIHEYNIDTFGQDISQFVLANEHLKVPIYLWLSRDIISELRKSLKSDKSIEIMNKISDQFKYMAGLTTRTEIDKSNVRRYFITGYDTHYRSCFMPQLFGLIAADGNVFPCCYMYEPVFSMQEQQLQFVLGNINSSTLMDIYSGEAYYRIVHKFRQCEKCFTQCKFCDRFDHINVHLNEDIKKRPIFL